MAQSQKLGKAKLDGSVIIGELIRNMELGRFEMTYTVLLPCIFTVYLNPQDHAMLSGVFDLIAEDARRALRARVTDLNKSTTLLGIRRAAKPQKEYKIACRDWSLEFLPEPEIPSGDVEIHSQLNETADPQFRGTRTTLMEREPSAAAERRTTSRTEARRTAEGIVAEIRYEDDAGPQTYPVAQNLVRIGRGGDTQRMDIALYTTDEVSREHLNIRRDAATGNFFITDLSTNGTWVNSKRIKKGSEEPLPSRAEINLGGVLTLSFETKA